MAARRAQGSAGMGSSANESASWMGPGQRPPGWVQGCWLAVKIREGLSPPLILLAVLSKTGWKTG